MATLPTAPSPAAYTDFGVRLFRAAAEGAEGRNLFVSPVSAGMALAMAWNGATGDARDEMARVLDFEGKTREAVNAAHADLRAALEGADVELAIAGALWMDGRWRFSDEFMERARRSFGAAAETVDFGSPAAAERINAWAAEATRGRIPRIASFPFPALTLLMLASAVYFKGRWSDPFDADDTRERPFRTGDGRTIDHPLMERRDWYRHHQGDGFGALRMPYGDDDRFAMYVVLPDDGTDIGALVAGLTGERLEEVFGRMEHREVIVAFPRFTLRGTLDLVAPLRALGMRAPFAAGTVALADLFPPEVLPSVPQAYIGAVTHDTFIEVNEEGTEAAAVTSIAAAGGSAYAPPPPLRFTVDRPFLALVRDDRTGALLFLGQVTNPGERAGQASDPDDQASNRS